MTIATRWPDHCGHDAHGFEKGEFWGLDLPLVGGYTRIRRGEDRQSAQEAMSLIEVKSTDIGHRTGDASRKSIQSIHPQRDAVAGRGKASGSRYAP